MRFLTNFNIAHRLFKMAQRPSSDFAAFNKELQKAKHVVVLTGAGVSAESGIPTFRGSGGFWRTFQAQDLATPQAFNRDPGLVWEFYHYRRELVLQKSPNEGHRALARLEQQLKSEGRQVVIITQNIDGFHAQAGSENVLELHGHLFKTRCLNCRQEVVNRQSPICAALRGKGSPDPDAKSSPIAANDLPHCPCGGLLRPAVVWFGENLDPDVLDSTHEHLTKCDLCLIVGTSAVVYPAAGFGVQVAARGVTVAEFNLETTGNTDFVTYHFEGPSGETLPKALGV